MRKVIVIAALFAAIAAQATPKPEHAKECKSIENQLKQLDEQGRKAMSGTAQDQHRAATRRVRDRQFELKC